MATHIAEIAQFSSRLLAGEGLIGLLTHLASREVSRQSTRWIPLAGRLIAASIGWRYPFRLGEQLVVQAESLANEILANLVEGSEVAQGA